MFMGVPAVPFLESDMFCANRHSQITGSKTFRLQTAQLSINFFFSKKQYYLRRLISTK
jgi:hypothetical protein